MVVEDVGVENQPIASDPFARCNYGFLSRFVFKTFPIFHVIARADNAPAE